jgi:hypothetical protein
MSALCQKRSCVERLCPHSLAMAGGVWTQRAASTRPPSALSAALGHHYSGRPDLPEFKALADQYAPSPGCIDDEDDGRWEMYRAFSAGITPEGEAPHRESDGNWGRMGANNYFVNRRSEVQFPHPAPKSGGLHRKNIPKDAFHRPCSHLKDCGKLWRW